MGGVVGGRLRGGGDGDREREGRGEDDRGADDRGGDEATGASSGAHQEDQEEQGPDDVELLLDREGPELLERGGRLVGVEVLGLLGDEAVVDDVDDDGEGVLEDRFEARHGVEHPRAQGGRDGDDGSGGQDAAGAAGVEPGDGDAAGRVDLLDEQGGDEEPGEDEEHVYADVTSCGPGEPGVREEDQADGDGAQALDVGPEPQAGPAVGRGDDAGQQERVRASGVRAARGGRHRAVRHVEGIGTVSRSEVARGERRADRRETKRPRPGGRGRHLA
nr:hypothetical protein GCM10025732_12740 [Glycomyces mayteni]